MSTVITSLNAVTVPTVGTVLSLDALQSDFVMQVSVLELNTNETVDVAFQGSLDGVNWASMNAVATGTSTIEVSSPEGTSPVVTTMYSIAATPLLYVRANLLSISASDGNQVTAVIGVELD